MGQHLRSLIKLFGLVIAESLRIVGAVVRGDFPSAAEHARVLAMVVHEDAAQIVVALQQTLPFWRAPRGDVDRILVVKLDRIGDMVNTTPVFDALHEAFPKARLDIVAHPTPLVLLDGDDRIGERIPYRCWYYHPMPIRPLSLAAWWLVIKLLRRRYPLVVYLRGSLPFLALGITSRLAAAKFVVGEPVIQRYLKPIEALLGHKIQNPTTRLRIDPEAARFAHNQLGKRDRPTGPRVAIHATTLSLTRLWRAERYAAVADELHESCGASVHFFGSPEEKAALENIARLSAHAHVFHDSLRLPQVVAALAACDLFIGNDSALAHIAAAVGTPVVVVWGASSLSMSRPSVPPDRCAVLYHDLPCRAVCPETHCVNAVPLECLTQIQTADVVVEAKRLLTTRP
jgi:ADP-heptose:LPS heptosyltransferase